ncbi:hypothetical protein [Haloarcula pelagica]|uniref:hypothetical protein n=1 Tax=Haloarcula pelagica TaxID=3033389 RepID=UPI0024C2370C|nr:hypothetical protein [Halomicroarcula sp. YJ-61-S]
MPSEQQAGDRDERLRCPTTRERIGEDPARWLDRELITDADRRRIVLTLIDGMDSIERVRAWKACERRLANPQADDNPRNPLEEPRAKIIHRLEQREAWLELHGERPERLPEGPRRPCDCCGADGGVSAADLRERDAGAAGRLAEGYSPDGVDVDETSTQTEAATIGQFATDGGEPE